MRFRFSGTLMRFVDFQRELAVAAPTIAGGFEQLIAAHPQLRAVLFTGAGALRGTHRLFLNGEQLAGEDLGRAVGEADTVEILTALAGG